MLILLTSAAALAWDPTDPDTVLECELVQGREVQRWSGTMRDTQARFEFQHTMEMIDAVDAVLTAQATGSPEPQCCSTCSSTDIVCFWTCSNDPPCIDIGECQIDDDCPAATHCVASHCQPLPGCPCGLQYNDQMEASCAPCSTGPGLWTWFADMFDFSIDWPWVD